MTNCSLDAPLRRPRRHPSHRRRRRNKRPLPGSRQRKRPPARLALFEKVRTKRAARVQVVSKVTVGKEREVEEELEQYLEDGIVGTSPTGYVLVWWYGKLTV